MDILKAGNKEYILKFNFRALAELQDRGINLASDQEFKIKDIVTLVQIGLKKHHPKLTEDDVFDLMDDFLEEYELEEIMVTVQKAMEKAVGKKQPNPKK